MAVSGNTLSVLQSLKDDVDNNARLDLKEVQSLIDKNFSETPCYEPEEIARKLRKTDEKLSIFHLNIRSMAKNFEDLKIFLTQLNYKFSFICLTETWSKEELVKNTTFSLPEYSLVYQNRECKDKGGGVCIYAHESFTYKIRKDLSRNTNDLESLSIEVEQNEGKNFILTTLYRPPCGNLNEFMLSLETHLSTCSNKPIYIAADFNINILRYHTSKCVQRFIDLIFEHGSVPTINKPTRVTRRNATAIDNIITNSFISDNLESAIIQTDLTDHFPIVLLDDLKCLRKKRLKDEASNEREKVLVRSFCNENLEIFRHNLAEQDWSFLYNFNDAEQSFEYFLRIFFKMYDEAFPKREVVLKLKSSEPWMTKGLKKSSKRKQRLYQNFLRNRTVKNETIYKKYRNNFNKYLRLAKRLYISDLLLKYRKDIKMTWRTVNDLIGKKKTEKSNFPESIFYKNKEVSSKRDIAEIFNKFFTSVGSNLASKIPESSKPFTDFLHRVDKEMVMKDVNDNELKAAFLNLESNKSAGFDEISPKVVKYISIEVLNH